MDGIENAATTSSSVMITPQRERHSVAFSDILTAEYPSTHISSSSPLSSLSTTSLVGKDEEYIKLKKELLAKKLQAQEIDFYLKKLEALDRERALNLPPSRFTVDLINRQQ